MVVNGTLLALDPVAFQLGSLSVRWYGILIATGVLLAYLIVQREAKRLGMDEEFFIDLLLWAMPMAIIGARLYYVVFEWERYADQPIRALYIWEGGIAIHGALIAGILTAYFFAKKRNVSFWKVGDIAVPGIFIGQIIGRWGNFMNQEAHGGPVSETFLQQTPIPNWIMEQMTIQGVTYHPTFLYESLWNTVGLLFVLFFRRRNPRRGEIFLFYVGWYSLGRLFIEGMRTDSLVIGGLRMAQIVSLTGIAIAVIFFIYRRWIRPQSTRYEEA